MIRKIIKKLVTLILFFTLVGFTAIGIKYFINPRKARIEDITSDRTVYFSNISQIIWEDQLMKQKVPKLDSSGSSIKVVGWIADYQIKKGLQVAQEKSGQFETLSPMMYNLNKDGILETNSISNIEDLLNQNKNDGVEIIPTISGFDANGLASVLRDSTKLQKHVDDITNLVLLGNFDGIDIDYEVIFLQDKKLFFKFLQTLADSLHAHNKKIVYSAMPKWNDKILYNSSRLVLDYEKLGKIVDEIRIQGYHFGLPSDNPIVPIAPIGWQETLIRYAIYKNVPREKIVLGTNTYAFDFTERNLTSEVNFLDKFKVNYNPTSDLPVADIIANSDVETIKSKFKFDVSYNSEWGEALGTYVYKGENRIVLFPTTQSIKDRKDLAAVYGIKGIAIWSIGSDGNLQY